MAVHTARFASAQQPVPGPAVATAVRRTLSPGELERFADSVFAPYLREYAQPSLAVAVVHHDTVVLLKGYGSESGSPRRAVDPESTLFNIASISKLFTTIAALQLVQQGRLSLDADVRSRLGRDVILGDGPPITLRMLLTHTSGVDGAFMRDVVATPRELVPLAEYFRRFPVRRGRPPGREIRYSNVGMALVGRLVEVASGAPFERYVDERVLAPFGMHHSTFRQPPREALAERVATYGSGSVPDALLLAPAGAMVSTAADMGRFMLAQLVIADDARSEAVTPWIRSSMLATQWSADPAIPGVGFGFFHSDLGGVDGVFHTGARTHFSLLYLVPGERLGIFVVHAMRQGGPHQMLRTDFVRALLDRFMGQRTMPTTEPPMASRSVWPTTTSFAGTYRASLLATTTIERAAQLGMDTPVRAARDGSLTMDISGGPHVLLHRDGPWHFLVSDGPHRGLHVAFVHETSGAVTGFAMSGDTQDPVSFERLAWYERGTLHAIVLGLITASFAITVIATLASVLFRRIHHGRRGPALIPSGARWAWRAAIATGTLGLLAPLSTALLVLTHRGDDAAAGLRFALTVGLTILLLATVVGLTLPPLAVAAWRGRYWSAGRRIHFSLLALGIVIAVPLLAHLHLLGYWL